MISDHYIQDHRRPLEDPQHCFISRCNEAAALATPELMARGFYEGDGSVGRSPPLAEYANITIHEVPPCNFLKQGIQKTEPP